MIEILTLPFMQRALVGGAVVSLILGWLGVFITSRNMSFIGAGIAHASLGSIALAIVLGWTPLPVALILSVFLAIALYWLDQKTNVSRDTAIGIIFAAGMALGILLLQYHEGYVPELVGFLFGNILAVKTLDLWLVVGVGGAVLFLLSWFWRQLTFTTVDAEGAQLAGVNRSAIDLLMYVLTAVSVVLSIKLVGIVLVSALLVLPSAVGKSLASSFVRFQVLSVITSVIMVFCGLLLSYAWDLPSGAVIVLLGTVIFVLTKLLQYFLVKNNG